MNSNVLELKISNYVKFQEFRIDLSFLILEFKLLAHCQMRDFENPE